MSINEAWTDNLIPTVDNVDTMCCFDPIGNFLDLSVLYKNICAGWCYMAVAIMYQDNSVSEQSTSSGHCNSRISVDFIVLQEIRPGGAVFI